MSDLSYIFLGQAFEHVLPFDKCCCHCNNSNIFNGVLMCLYSIFFLRFLNVTLVFFLRGGFTSKAFQHSICTVVVVTMNER